MKRWIYAILAIELTAIVVFSLAWDSLDFRIYMLGGRALPHGADLYLQQQAAHWFTNTPFAATVFLPLSYLPLTFTRLLWQLGSAAALAYACTTTLKLAGRAPSRFQIAAATAICLALEPMYHSFFLGQVNLYLLALVTADMHRVSQNRNAGVLIGIAAAIKLTPGIFIVLLLVTRHTKAAVTAAATFVLAGSLAYAISPEASKVYWHGTFVDTSRVGVTYISNQSPNGALARILHRTSEIGAWYSVIPLAIGTAGLAIAALHARRSDWLTATAVTGATGLLVSPISWSHHWVWILPALAVLLRNGHRKSAGCAYILFVFAPEWWTPHNGAPLEYGFHPFLTPVANSYLLVGVAFLAYTARTLRTNNQHPTQTDKTLEPHLTPVH